jgi:hypothetical protein
MVVSDNMMWWSFLGTQKLIESSFFLSQNKIQETVNAATCYRYRGTKARKHVPQEITKKSSKQATEPSWKWEDIKYEMEKTMRQRWAPRWAPRWEPRWASTKIGTGHAIDRRARRNENRNNVVGWLDSVKETKYRNHCMNSQIDYRMMK